MKTKLTLTVLLFLVLGSVGLAAQSAAPRKDIPAIAKAANGSIVSIVMSDKDGNAVAQGTGFLVSKDGLIVTNYHVIAEGSSAIVKIPDGAFYVVDGVLAFDKGRDVAVIKAHGQNFRTLTLGNSDRVQVGEEVVAIGNPLSLESTVSNGIISGIRTAEEQGGKFLQVTAPISPGSSGGPLFDMTGNVIGITTLYLKGGENLNFAIPINDAKRLFRMATSRLQNLPNEPESAQADAPSPTTGEGAIPQMNSPAYQSYQELLKSEDVTFRASTYACFDDYQQNKTFMVIEARLLDKQTMMVVTQDFRNGVSSETGDIFHGPLGPFSGAHGLFATLHTMRDTKDNPSHQTDVFEWGPDVLTMRAGFGELSPGQVRATYEFRMRRSTGRYTEDQVFGNGSAPEGFTVNKTGKCIRIPNTPTPEEVYRSLSDEHLSSNRAADPPLVPPTNPLPPNTKIAASPPDPAHATQEQLWEDIIYCHHNPANNLQLSDGTLVGCAGINASLEEREKECRSKGAKDTPEHCKGFLKSYKDLKAGRLQPAAPLDSERN